MFVSLTRIKKVINNPISGWMFLWQYIKARLLKYKKIKNILPSNKYKFLIEDEVFLKLLEKNIDLKLSFGWITLQHWLAKLILLEQVYRITMIAQNRSYHY